MRRTHALEPKVRPGVFPRRDEGGPLPVWWWGDNAWASHVVNALNLLFPAGERFFVRSVRHHLTVVDDPALRDGVRRFAGQEMQHGRAHELAFEALEAQGFEVRSFLRWYEWLGYEVIEPNTSPVLRLAVTAALEHYTAALAEQALSTSLLDNAHPAMRDLLRWHAAEEIEHRSVAFDVLQAVDPRLRTRVAGLTVATIVLLGFWSASATHLVRQDRALRPGQLWADLRAARARGQQPARVIGAALRDFLARDFHPDDRPTAQLARDWLASHGELAET